MIVPAPTFTFVADRRVAEIRQVIGLRVRAERGLFQLDEVADPGALADSRLGPQVRERTESCAGIDARTGDDARSS